MKRYKHNLSHYKIADYDNGKLYPVSLTEVLPGDTVQQSTQGLIRVSPLVVPVMHPVHVRFHHWFVPYRLIWEDWEDFITGGDYGSTPPVFPTIEAPASAPWLGWSQGGIMDHLGVLPEVASLEVSALPIRAMNLIWNEWFRDQDLQSELAISVASGPDTTTSVGGIISAGIPDTNWDKDFFTTQRPWPQKGADVGIPFADEAPVTGIGKVNQTYTAGAQNVYETDGTGTTSYASSKTIDPADPNNVFRIEEDPNNAGFPNIRANLSSAPGSILDLRDAFATQRWLEARARYGSRYTEYLRYLGVRSSDARLQRPEYLGGGKQTIQFSEVLQTGVDSSDDGLGNLGGHGIATARSNRYRRFFEEHGFIITTMCIRPIPVYAQALDRLWNKRTKFDFWTKEFERIGDQEVPKFLLNPDNVVDPNDPFGYQPRYEEYRRTFNRVSGSFRDSTNPWTFARVFTGGPTLNGTFTSCIPRNTPFAATSEPQYHAMIQNKIVARRLVAPSGGNSYVI